MKMGGRIWSAGIIVISLVLCASSSDAEEPELARHKRHKRERRAKRDGASRTLNGHAFIPQLSVVFPFASTFVGTTLVAGGAQVEATGFDLQGNAVTDSLDVVALDTTIDLGLRVTDWVGLRGRYLGRAHTGRSLRDLLGGASIEVQYQLGAGLVGRLVATERFRLALALRFAYFEGRLGRIGDALAAGLRLAVNPESSGLDELAARLARGDITLEQFRNRMRQQFASSFSGAAARLRVKTSGWQVSPALTAAYAPVRYVGIQSSIDYLWTTQQVDSNDPTVSADTSQSGVELGVSVSLDLRDVLLPVAIPVAYQVQHTFDNAEMDGATSNLVETGIYYSGRDALDLGLVFLWTFESDKANSYLGGLRFNYVW